MRPDDGNDRDTALADRNATHDEVIRRDATAATPVPAALGSALDRLRLDGAIFFRSEFSEGWSYESPAAAAELADTLRPGAERLIIFHIVARGTCWVSLQDGERHWAREGDVIVLPYGDPHRMGGSEPSICVPIFSLLDPPPWETLPVLRHGAGGERTDVICGYLHSKDPLFDPGMRALPPVFVARPPEGPAAQWVRSSIEYALAISSPSGGDDPAWTKLPEVLFMEVLRLHLASAPSADHGWIGALRDPVLAPALAQLHAEPERRWTVSELAKAASVSRSLLDERFRQVLGQSPIRYLSGWRMHLATDLLTSTDLGVAQVAHRVGYESEEAFSRAFKRRFGTPPSAWRAPRATRRSPGPPSCVRPRVRGSRVRLRGRPPAR
jgi:AraC-like DNA-binding protein